MINETLLINLNNESNFKFSYCYDAINTYCVQNGYNVLYQNQITILILNIIIIFLIIYLIQNGNRKENKKN